MNKLYYSVLYNLTHGGHKKDTERIFFASPIELDGDQIKAYIQQRINLPNAYITLKSINKLNKETFIAIGGDPHKSFKNFK